MLTVTGRMTSLTDSLYEAGPNSSYLPRKHNLEQTTSHVEDDHFGALSVEDGKQTVIEYGRAVIPPKQRLEFFIELIFVLYGMGVLLPFNITLNSITPIMTDIHPKTSWAFQWGKASNTGFLSGFLILVLMTSDKVSLRTRFMASWSTMAGAAIALTIMLLTLPRQRVGFVLSLLTIYFLDMATAVASAAVVGFSYLLTNECSERYFLGQSLSGVLSFSIYLITSGTLMRLDNGVTWTIAVSYAVASFSVILCVLILPWLMSRPSVKRVMAEKNVSSSFYQDMTRRIDNDGLVVECSHPVETGGASQTIPQRLKDLGHIVTIAWGPLLANFLSATITSFLVPGVISELTAVDDFPNLLTWMVGCNQIGDVVGRVFASCTQFHMKGVWTILSFRSLVLTLCILSQRISHVFLQSSPFRLLLALLIGITNGWLFTLSCLRVPDRAVGSKQIEDCGFFASLSIIAGFVAGAYLSPLSQIGVNP